MISEEEFLPIQRIDESLNGYQRKPTTSVKLLSKNQGILCECDLMSPARHHTLSTGIWYEGEQNPCVD